MMKREGIFGYKRRAAPLLPLLGLTHAQAESRTPSVSPSSIRPNTSKSSSLPSPSPCSIERQQDPHLPIPPFGRTSRPPPLLLFGAHREAEKTLLRLCSCSAHTGKPSSPSFSLSLSGAQNRTESFSVRRTQGRSSLPPTRLSLLFDAHSTAGRTAAPPFTVQPSSSPATATKIPLILAALSLLLITR